MDQASVKIPLLSVEEAERRAKTLGLNPAFAKLSVFRVLLIHPKLADVISKQLIMLLYKGELEDRLRELIIMRIGWVTGADYEWTQHWPIALDCGCSEADLIGVQAWQSYAGFNTKDRAVLQAVDDMLSEGMILPDTFETFETVGLNDLVKLEIIAAINNWRGFSQLLKSLQIPLEDGIASWPPNGQAPS